jgi:hypothetical protein
VETQELKSGKPYSLVQQLFKTYQL